MWSALVFAVSMAAPSPPSAGVPLECLASGTSAGENVWERAKVPELRRYCEVLASAAAKLASEDRDAARIVALARRAEKLLPGRAAPQVVLARAHAAAGNWAESAKAMSEARKRSDRALDDASALVVWARAQRQLGHADEALRAYRALLPRASALPAHARNEALVEAALVMMRAGPTVLGESLAVLRLASASSRGIDGEIAHVALALALSRAERGAESQVVLASHPHAGHWIGRRLREVTERLQALGGSADLQALRAVAAPVRDARGLWARYAAEAPSGDPWVDHARQQAAKPRQGR